MSTAATPLSANVMAALGAANETFEKSRADNGAAPRPPKGDWDNILSDIEIETEDVTFQKTANKEGPTVPAFLVRFTYSVLGDTSPVPPDFKAGQPWTGKSFVIPMVSLSELEGYDKSGDRHKKRAGMASMETARLKGHLSAILQEKFSGNIQADLPAAMSLVKAGNPVVVRVSCIYDQDEKDPTRVYFKDKIAKRLA